MKKKILFSTSKKPKFDNNDKGMYRRLTNQELNRLTELTTPIYHGICNDFRKIDKKQIKPGDYFADKKGNTRHFDGKRFVIVKSKKPTKNQLKRN